MNQTGDSSNFVQIGDAGNNNAYKVIQNTTVSSTPMYVQLEVDRDSIRRYPKAEIERRALWGAIVPAIPFSTTFISLFSDWLGILSFLGWNKFSIIVVSFHLGIVFATLTAIVEERNVTSLYYWVKSKFMRRGEPKLLESNRFLEVDDEGNYLTYAQSGPCSYPACAGKIIVTKLPPREQHREQLAGVCSVAGKAHSYLIDYNAIAMPRELDWRPAEPPSYTSGYRR